MNNGLIYKTITYLGQAELTTAPRRRIYIFEPFKSVPIGFKKKEVHPKDAEQLARKINSKGELIFILE